MHARACTGEALPERIQGRNAVPSETWCPRVVGGAAPNEPSVLFLSRAGRWNLRTCGRFDTLLVNCRDSEGGQGQARIRVGGSSWSRPFRVDEVRSAPGSRRRTSRHSSDESMIVRGSRSSSLRNTGIGDSSVGWIHSVLEAFFFFFFPPVGSRAGLDGVHVASGNASRVFFPGRRV